MSTPQMHSDSASAAPEPKEVLCPVDLKMFVPERSWQKFCSVACRNTYHRTLTPEALRKDVDALRGSIADLKAGNEALNAKVGELEQRVASLDSPVK